MKQDLEKQLDILPRTELKISSKTYEIPLGQPLIRALQYLELKGAKIEVTRGPFCWNGDCKSCVCDIESEGNVKIDQKICRFRVKGKVEITKLNDNFNYHD